MKKVMSILVVVIMVSLAAPVSAFADSHINATSAITDASGSDNLSEREEWIVTCITRHSFFDYQSMITKAYDLEGRISRITVKFYDENAVKHTVRSEKFTSKNDLKRAFEEIKQEIDKVDGFKYYVSTSVAWKAKDGKTNLCLGLSETDPDGKWAGVYTKNGVAYDPSLQYLENEISMKKFEEDYNIIKRP